MTATLIRPAFTVGAQAFASAVSWAAERTPSRPAIPVLGCLLLEVVDGALTVSGFDYDTAGSARLDVEGSDGRWLVSSRLLAGLADTFPDNPLTIVEVDGRLALQCGTSKFTLPLAEVGDYPTIPTSPQRTGEVDADAFARAVKRVVFAVSDQPGMPQRCGVGVRTSGACLELAAFDGYRIASTRVAWTPDDPDAELDLLVPPAALRPLSRMAAAHASLTLSTSGTLLGLASGNLTAVSGLLAPEFQWPAINHARAVASETPARVPVAPLLEALKRAKLLAPDQGTAVRLSFAPDSLHVLSGAEASGDDGVPCTYAGPLHVIGFRMQFLHDALTACGTAEVDLRFKPDNLAVRFDPVGDDSYLHVVQAVDLSYQPKVATS